MKPDQPACGNTSVELFPARSSDLEADEGAWHELETLRGCHVQVTGRLGLPTTGYYSAPIYITADKERPDSDCVRKSALPDFSKEKPSATVRTYRVHMMIHYKGDGSVRAVVRSRERDLNPWQAYAGYILTGGSVFYGSCAEGYTMSRIGGTRAAHPEQLVDGAALDPEIAAQHGVRNLYLNFTCTR